MKKLLYIMAIACMMACQNDDTDFSAYTSGAILQCYGKRLSVIGA